MGFYNDSMGFYSDSMGFYGDSMGFDSDLMGYEWDVPSGNDWHSYGKWQFIVHKPIRHGDFP